MLNAFIQNIKNEEKKKIPGKINLGILPNYQKHALIKMFLPNKKEFKKECLF